MSRSWQNKSISCFKCGRKDHFARDCLKSKSAKQHHRAKKAEKREDTESDSGGGNEMFVAKVGRPVLKVVTGLSTLEQAVI